MRSWIMYLVALACAPIASVGQSSYVQFLHCSRDSALTTVDIWMDTTLVADGVQVLTATPWIAAAPNLSHVISICPANSVDTSSAIYRDTLFIMTQTRYQAFLNGTPSAGYTPQEPIDIIYRDQARIMANQTDESDVLYYHGVTDLPKSDLFENGFAMTTLADDFAYHELPEYASIETLDYLLQLRDSSGTQVIREWEFPIATEGLRDSAFAVVITGFQSPANNANGPSLAAYIAPPSGGNFIPLEIGFAQVKFIHNATDPGLNTIDIYRDVNATINNLTYRTSSAYISVPSGIESRIGIASGNSTSANDTIINRSFVFQQGKSYALIIDGLEDVGISPFQPLNIAGFEPRLEATLGSNVDVILHHGCTDLAETEVYETEVLMKPLVPSLQYGDISDYRSLPAATYKVDLRDGKETVLKSYEVNFQSEAGQAQLWIISGFQDTALADSNRALGIFRIGVDAGPFQELTEPTGISENTAPSIRIAPNPTSGQIRILGLTQPGTYRLWDAQGVLVDEGTSASNIQLPQLPTGIYSLELTGQQGQSLHRLCVVN